MKRLWTLGLILMCVVAGCTQAVLTPFSEIEAPPEVRVLVTLVTPHFERAPEGTLYFLDIPEWDIIGVPAFVTDGFLSASFSVSSVQIVEGAPVVVVLLRDDPAFCGEAPPFIETTGFIVDWMMEQRTAEFILDGLPDLWPCE